MSDEEIGGGLGDYDGIEGMILSKPCMAIFNFLYLVDGLALIVIAGMALNGGGDFSSESDDAFYALIGGGCVMLLVGIMSCISIWTECYNSTPLCIIYCLLVTGVNVAITFAIVIINSAGDQEITDQFTKAVDGVIIMTYALNLFGYASVIRTNKGARECMECLCGDEE